MGRFATSGRRILAGVTVFGALIGCSGADEATRSAADSGWDVGGDADDAAATPEMPGADEDAAADRDGRDDGDRTGAGSGDADGPARPVSAQMGRQVIRSAELVLEVDDPAATADAVAAISADAGGFVAETDLQRDAQGVVRGSITLRVPSATLLATVDALDALGVAVPVRRIDERDVTTEVTDLGAMVTNLTAYERELRSLLTAVRETTSRPDDLLIVFERIREVREEIDRAEARLAVLSDQVSLSTIAVTLRPAPTALPVTDPTWAPGQTAREALATTVRALTGFADLGIRLGLTALPIAAVFAVPVAVGASFWHRRRHGSEVRSRP